MKKIATVDPDRTPEAQGLLDRLVSSGVRVEHHTDMDTYTLEHGGMPAYMVAGELIEDLSWHLGAVNGDAFVRTVKRPWTRDKILGYRNEHGGPIHE